MHRLAQRISKLGEVTLLKKVGDVRRYREGLISNLTKRSKNGIKLNILVQNSTARMVKIFSELIGSILDLFETYLGTKNRLTQ